MGYAQAVPWRGNGARDEGQDPGPRTQDRKTRARTRCRAPALFVALVAGSALSCVSESPQPTLSEPTAASEQAFSPAGIERVIPLRIIQTMNPTGYDQRALYARMQRQVASANATYHTAGIQFYIKVFKRCSSTGLLVDLTGTPVPTYTWAQVKNDIVCAIPNAASQINDPFPNDPKTARFWENWATMKHGDQSELVVWLRTDAAAHDAQGPWAGNSIHFQQGDGNAGKLPHELVHSLGIPHTFGVAGFIADSHVKDPETGQQFQWADFWDVIFKQGATNTFYSNRASVPASGLSQIDTELNCAMDQHHQITCILPLGAPDSGPFWDIRTWPCQDPQCALKGMGFTFTSQDNPPATYKYGANAASYLHDSYWNGVSDSYIRVLRKFLRYDVVITDGSESGSEFVGTVNRTSLRGQWLNRQPAYDLDFDHDGKRDFGWWEQPTATGVNGWFRVQLSNGGTMNVPCGQLGDVPVPADYNGDGYADVAVFQPGGGVTRQDPESTAAYWRFCPTNAGNPAGTVCAAPIFAQYGEREDVPLPGLDFDGSSSTSHLAVFRPSQRLWVWGPVADYDSQSSRWTLAGEGTTTVPLPGRYDYDTKTDIAAYDTITGKFFIVTSTSNWDSAHPIIRTFTPPTDGGQPIAHAVPIPGMVSHEYTWGSYQPRLAAAIWWPDIGYWNVIWNPVYNDSRVACQWGQSGDVPMGGIGSSTWNLPSPSYSRATVYRSIDNNGPGYFYFREMSAAGCGGQNPAPVTSTPARPRTIAYPVRDMGIDGLPEIFIVNQDDTQTINYLLSNEGYQVPHPVNVPVPAGSLGTHMFVLL
jgi:hypothetical protein